MFDDHDLTDDLFLSPMWRRRVQGSTLGQVILTNGMLAYALFQDWGNDPRRYDQATDADRPDLGGQLPGDLLVRAAGLFPAGRAPGAGRRDVHRAGADVRSQPRQHARPRRPLPRRASAAHLAFHRRRPEARGGGARQPHPPVVRGRDRPARQRVARGARRPAAASPAARRAPGADRRRPAPGDRSRAARRDRLPLDLQDLRSRQGRREHERQGQRLASDARHQPRCPRDVVARAAGVRAPARAPGRAPARRPAVGRRAQLDRQPDELLAGRGDQSRSDRPVHVQRHEERDARVPAGPRPQRHAPAGAVAGAHRRRALRVGSPGRRPRAAAGGPHRERPRRGDARQAAAQPGAAAGPRVAGRQRTRRAQAARADHSAQPRSSARLALARPTAARRPTRHRAADPDSRPGRSTTPRSRPSSPIRSRCSRRCRRSRPATSPPSTGCATPAR